MAAFEAQKEQRIGTIVAARYRITKLLGEGGMGQVFQAVHEAIEKRVALKILRRELSYKQDIVDRFQQEAISASRIKHPNVLDVFDFGRLDDGSFFLAMELLEGQDLGDLLEKEGMVEPFRALRISIQVCKALAAAHAQGVIHRDLKPENVFLTRTAEGEEIAKIVDFGIAQLRTTEEVALTEPRRRRLTKTGMIFGTPEYMAPEQAAGGSVDERSDLYAVGVILYEMLCGAVPFSGDSFMAVLTAHLHQPVPPLRSINTSLDISPELEAVLMQALAKDPVLRFGSMQHFAQALRSTPEGRLIGSMTQAPGDLLLVKSSPPTRSEPRGAAALTQLTERSKSRAVPWVALIAVALVVIFALGAGGVLLNAQRLAASGSPTMSAESPRPEPTPSASASTPPTTPSTTPSVTAPPLPAPTGVALDVVTEPAGATVLQDGAQVCDAAPCTVTVASGATVEIEARKGALKASMKVRANRPQTVRLTLRGAAAAPAPVKTCLKEFTDENGLKMVKEVPCN